MKEKKLKAALADRGLDAKGKKPKLIERLIAAIKDEEKQVS